ncbi:hypothetical protein ACQ5SO_13685 [Rhodovulum sp. DZ06]|uniref:hypothetical protein n=1 Tax=Rhodovulum sp. DZ06 TaxID=3425126 RepID=UPI003D356667
MPYSTDLVLSGPLRAPRQMLADQEYGGHSSIHDDATAETLGFRAGPIEGPTHFSQFDPLMARIWGRDWFEKGCISSHFLNMVVEGEEVRAFASMPAPGATTTRAWAEKADGTPVLEASASIGPDHGETLLEARVKALRPHGPLVILGDMRPGLEGAEAPPEAMGMEEHNGPLYPFTLAQKLERMTEISPWHAGDNPWGRPIIPTEMVSVLAERNAEKAGWPVKHPAVGLYADLEVRMVDGPLFVDEPYLIRREIVALAETRRTESYWVRTRIFDAAGKVEKARTLLNHAVLKQSHPGYDEKRAALEAAAG